MYFEEELHENVKEFGERSFSQNKLLKDFSIPSNVTKLGEWVFYSTSMTDLNVHSGVTEINSYCFSWNSNLINASVKTNAVLGTNLFANCTKLDNVILGNISAIPDSMFANCSKLNNIEIPETVTNIGAYVFNNTGLVTIEIPSNVKSIGDDCFTGCANLGDINCLPIKAPTLGTNVFGNNDSNYTGSKAPNKRLDVTSNATGYESGD